MTTTLHLEALRRELASEIAQLPRLAGMLDGFLTATAQECAGLDAIASHLAADDGLRTWILRQANSGFTKLQRPVADLGEACVVLGLEPVTRLAFAACTQNLLQHDPGPYPGTPRGFWLHGLATGCAAAHLAAALGDRSPLAAESARIAGLLHDVGKQLVARRWPRGEDGPVHADHEVAVVGFDHAQASAAVAAAWQLPAPIIDAVAAHHAPRPRGGAVVIQVADRLMNRWRVGTATYPACDVEPDPAALATGLLPTDIVGRWWPGCVAVVEGLDEMLRWSARPQAPNLETPGLQQPSGLEPTSRRRHQRQRRESIRHRTETRRRRC